MAVCSLEECLYTVIFALHETCKVLYLFVALTSWSLRDDGFGACIWGPRTIRVNFSLMMAATPMDSYGPP